MMKNIVNQNFSTPKKYIYIPNNSVLKSGAFNLVFREISFEKITSEHTHLYFRRKDRTFPGRIFETEEINSKAIKRVNNLISSPKIFL